MPLVVRMYHYRPSCGQREGQDCREPVRKTVADLQGSNLGFPLDVGHYQSRVLEPFCQFFFLENGAANISFIIRICIRIKQGSVPSMQ